MAKKGLRKSAEEIKEVAVQEEKLVLPEAPEVEITPVEEVVQEQPKVKIRPNRDLNTYIGDSWYNLKKGVVTTVPANVKEILRQAGALDTL